MREAPLWAVHTVNLTFPLDLLLADKDLNAFLDCGAFCSCLAYIDVVHTSESTISIELIVTLHDSRIFLVIICESTRLKWLQGSTHHWLQGCWFLDIITFFILCRVAVITFYGVACEANNFGFIIMRLFFFSALLVLIATTKNFERGFCFHHMFDANLIKACPGGSLSHRRCQVGKRSPDLIKLFSSRRSTHERHFELFNPTNGFINFFPPEASARMCSKFLNYEKDQLR